jgi:hypothetical protein
MHGAFKPVQLSDHSGNGEAATVGQFVHLTTQQDITPKNYLASA